MAERVILVPGWQRLSLDQQQDDLPQPGHFSLLNGAKPRVSLAALAPPRGHVSNSDRQRYATSGGVGAGIVHRLTPRLAHAGRETRGGRHSGRCGNHRFRAKWAASSSTSSTGRRWSVWRKDTGVEMAGFEYPHIRKAGERWRRIYIHLTDPPKEPPEAALCAGARTT